MPTNTDLVTDLPADFEVFGQAVATSMADLLGGTTGQVLAKASNTNMDFTWVAQDDSNAIQNSIVDAKGDLIAASANDTPARLAVGTNGQVLVADSTASTGLAWSTVASGAMTLLNSGSTSMSGSATKTISSISGSYNELWIFMYGVTNTVNNSTVYMNVNSDSTSGNYPNGSWWGTPGAAGNAFYSENTTYMSLNQYGASYWPNNTNNFTSMQIQGYTRAGSKNINYQQGLDGSNKTGLCMYEGSAAITSITITTSSSFTAGTIEVYGVK